MWIGMENALLKQHREVAFNEQLSDRLWIDSLFALSLEIVDLHTRFEGHREHAASGQFSEYFRHDDISATAEHRADPLHISAFVPIVGLASQHGAEFVEDTLHTSDRNHPFDHRQER